MEKKVLIVASKQVNKATGKPLKDAKILQEEPQYGVIHRGEFLGFPTKTEEMGRVGVCRLCPYQLACDNGDHGNNAPLGDMNIDDEETIT